jgi:integrase
VGCIEEGLVERVYLHLRNSPLSSGAKKKKWGFFRRFVKYLYERRLIDLPRNLGSFSFEVQPQKIREFTAEEVRTVLLSLSGRLRLYAHLGLNTGMTSVDIGQMTKDMVDMQRGTVVRRRVKTGHYSQVPTVTYWLWPETLELLREHRSSHESLFLTSADGTALWSARVEGDRTPTYDLVYQQFKRAKAPLTLKHFRSISASTLERHEVYGRYVGHFLGHSPKSIAERHYAAPSGELFRQALTWLRGQFYPGEGG